jgi:hypothetical protein
LGNVFNNLPQPVNHSSLLEHALIALCGSPP